MIEVATRDLFVRYKYILSDFKDQDDLFGTKCSIDNLLWMCTKAIEMHTHWPVDKSSRWLGFVQGCMAMRGLIDVDDERDLSRPMFHSAYEAMNIRLPESADSSLDMHNINS